MGSSLSARVEQRPHWEAGAPAVRRERLALPNAAAAVVAVAACAGLVRVGSDARWLAALGGAIVRLGGVPAGVPYAASPSGGWHNVPVLGELIFYGLERGLGDLGLVVAQLAAVSVALALFTLDAPVGGGLVLLLVPLGALDSFVIVRSQLFSLALFPVVVFLLRREADAPSRRVWLIVPLVALWSNLHGGVLVGLAVAAVYLVFERCRLDAKTALTVLAGCVLATLATPAGISTPAYYRGVFGNAWASSHSGLWARPSLHNPKDILFVAVAAILALIAVSGRPRLWEFLAAGGLAIAVATAARNEVWLVLFLAPAAMRGLRQVRSETRVIRLAVALGPLTAAALFLAVAWHGHAASDPGASRLLQSQAIAAARGTPILADPYDAEQLALRGAKIVIGNPIDAFSQAQQIEYRRWLNDAQSAETLTDTARVVLVQRTLPAQRGLARDPSFCRAGADSHAVLYVRCSQRPTITQ